MRKIIKSVLSASLLVTALNFSVSSTTFAGNKSLGHKIKDAVTNKHSRYNRHGYNQRGYNRHGYNQRGYNRHGYNQHGYNQHGYNAGGHYLRRHDTQYNSH